MENLNKYLGIKFRFHSKEKSNEYSNCLELAKRFYKDHGYLENLDDGYPDVKNRNEMYIKRMLKYLIRNFKRVESIDELEFGDIILLYTGAHIGIYLGDNKILAFEKECKENISVSRIFTVDEIGKNNIRFCYKRKI